MIREHSMWAALLSAALILTLCILPACGDKGDGGGKTSNGEAEKGEAPKDAAPKDWASMLEHKSAPDGFPCHTVSNEVMESAPVQFALRMVRDMPSPGYTIDVDSVTLQDDKKTIVAKLTTIAPSGAGLTVLEPRDLRFDLGSLAKGSYVFEIRERTSRDGDYTRFGSFAFQAK